jgi:hypothetical protein
VINLLIVEMNEGVRVATPAIQKRNVLNAGNASERINA